MLVSINQPAYLPWLGYFDRINKSDIHVVLDHVQFEKNSMVNRNKIISIGKESMLTIPLKTKGKFGDLAINKVEIAHNIKWIRKHQNAIFLSYAKAPNKVDLFDKLDGLYSGFKDLLLGDVLKSNLAFFLRELAIDKPKIVYSSEMNLHETKSDLVLSICKKLDATTYLSGPFGRSYLDRDSFKDNGIDIIFHDYKHPIYKQNSEEFKSCLSVLDLLFNEGSNALHILSKG